MQLKFPKHTKKFKKSHLYASPGLFWQILLVLAFLMIIASFVFGFLLFKRVNKDLVLKIEDEKVNSQIIKQTRIDAALKFFSDREEKSTEIINSFSSVVDPSF